MSLFLWNFSCLEWCESCFLGRQCEREKNLKFNILKLWYIALVRAIIASPPPSSISFFYTFSCYSFGEWKSALSWWKTFTFIMTRVCVCVWVWRGKIVCKSCHLMCLLMINNKGRKGILNFSSCVCGRKRSFNASNKKCVEDEVFELSWNVFLSSNTLIVSSRQSRW